MNLVQIHNGEDYAWFEWKGRGEAFRFNGKRVKIIRTFKEEHAGNTKASGYCEVFMLDDDGEFKTYNDEPITRKVRARDIAMLWDEYSDERDRLQIIRNKEEAERRARQEARDREYKELLERQRIEREERERIERERREKLEAERQEKNKLIYNWLAQRNIVENGDGRVRISITDQYVQVTIRREGFGG